LLRLETGSARSRGEGGWKIHDFHDVNPSAGKINANGVTTAQHCSAVTGHDRMLPEAE
jgi:hypothetical protein